MTHNPYLQINVLAPGTGGGSLNQTSDMTSQQDPCLLLWVDNEKPPVAAGLEFSEE